jgi:RNA polymerase sigma-70 factor (ECF subfamily)
MKRMVGIDEASVSRARAGDQAAFQDLVERHSRSVFKLAFRMRGRHDDHREAPDPTTGVSAVDSLAAGDPEPDRLVFGNQVHAEVEAALALLSPMERAAFVLRHFEERSIEEIGTTLGLRTNATKHSIFRAVRKMRARLEPMLGSAPGARRTSLGH